MENININDLYQEAKTHCDPEIGMFLVQNGIVKTKPGLLYMNLKKDNFKIEQLKNNILQKYSEIQYLNIYVNEGKLNIGDDIMYIIIGGKKRKNVMMALNIIMDQIKTECIIEEEVFE